MKKIKVAENNPSFSKIEDKIIEFWKENKIFEKSVNQRSVDNTFRFIDGPPFVSGDPHYASLLPSIAKDVIPRYWSMKGKRIERIFGWDCHGLPIEEKINKKLNIKKSSDIEKIGVDKYIEECRNFVRTCTNNWQWYVNKVGRFVDMDNAYYTMDLNFMESVIWGFSQIYKKGYIYKGKRVSLYSTDNETPVSQFEVAMDQDNYKDIEDLSIFVKFEIQKNKLFEEYEGRKIYAIAWTTTAWTIPSNFALCVNKNFTYSLVEYNNELYILAKDRIPYTFNVKQNGIGKSKDKIVRIIKDIDGIHLDGIKYKSIYNYFHNKNENDFKIYLSSDVVLNEGTGILHIAPAFGEMDFNIGKKYKLSNDKCINNSGEMIVGSSKFTYIRDAIPAIAKDLEIMGNLLRSELYTHRLPFYRGDNPLIYMAQDAYFIDIQKIKKRMIALNKDINWIPGHIKYKRFQHVLSTSPDWCISRNRYWATIMPIWKNNKGEEIVIESIEELCSYTDQIEKRNNQYFFEGKPFEFHKDICDKIILQKDKEQYTRIPEVLDVWMDSGSVPFAEYHYPFENEELFKKNPQSDYVIEYIGQVRAWFNVLLRVSTLIFDNIPFKNVLCTGVLAGEDGRKMSKSFGNFPDPKEVLENIGGEALRLYLMSSSIMIGEDMNWSDEILKEQTKNILIPLWNVYKYFTIYANLHNFKKNIKDKKSENILDIWILNYIDLVNKKYQEYIQSYNIPPTIKLIQESINTISSWYIRRSRDRFVSGDKFALNTLYEVLINFIKIFAPQMPFITERIYQDISQNKESIHLEDYPEFGKIKYQLLSSMDMVREVSSLGQSIRVENQIRLRQPLNKAHTNIKDKKMQDIIKNELNVKNIEYIEKLKNKKNYISKKSTFNKKTIFISIDIKIDENLKKEGILNDMIRHIQDIRKAQNFKQNQKCNIYYNTEEILLNDILKESKNYLLELVNAKDIIQKEFNDGKEVVIDNMKIKILIQ